MLRLRRALLLRAAAKDINLMSGGSAHVVGSFFGGPGSQ